MFKNTFLCIAILILIPPSGFAQDILNDAEKILIRNVTVIDQAKATEDVVVSILIEQKEIEIHDLLGIRENEQTSNSESDES